MRYTSFICGGMIAIVASDCGSSSIAPFTIA
jgi:hypothetical protein